MVVGDTHGAINIQCWGPLIEKFKKYAILRMTGVVLMYNSEMRGGFAKEINIDYDQGSRIEEITAEEA